MFRVVLVNMCGAISGGRSVVRVLYIYKVKLLVLNLPVRSTVCSRRFPRGYGHRDKGVCGRIGGGGVSNVRWLFLFVVNICYMFIGRGIAVTERL